MMEAGDKESGVGALSDALNSQSAGAGRYAALRRYLSAKARVTRTPLSGSFELTPLCNLDCRMCYVHLSREQMQGAVPLPVEAWIGMADEAIAAGMMYAQLTGGECLMYPGFRELYLFLQSRGIEITVKTNGLLLCGEMLSFLRSHPPAEITVSVYGADDEGYERVTGRRVFRQVMENVLAARSAGIPVSVSVTPNAFMTDGDRLLRLLKAHDLPWTINGGLMQPAAETGRGVEDASPETYAELLRLSALLAGETVGMRCEDDELPDTGTAQARDGSRQEGEEISCAAGRSCFAINWRGMLQPCINLNRLQYDVSEEGFASAWASLGERLHEITVPTECHGCAYRGICYICVAVHEGRAEPGHVCPEVCRWTRYMAGEGLLGR